MKRILGTIFLVFLVSSFFMLDAQVGNYLKNKAVQATGRAGQKADKEVTKEMNKQVDNEVEKAFNKLFNSDEEADSTSSTGEGPAVESEKTSGTSGNSQKSSGSSDARQKAMLKSMGISTAPANIRENYDYDGNILMNVQSWDADGNTDGEMEYYSYITDMNKGFALRFNQPDKGTSVMIFDYENQCMIILSDDGNEKSGFVSSYLVGTVSEEDSISSTADTEVAEEDYSLYNENLKKTGRTKNIAGYSCDEYVYEDEEWVSEMWITNDLPADLWTRMFSANVITAASFGYYGGFVMETDQKEKNTKSRSYMIVREVNPNQPETITTKGYQIMSFGMGTDE